MSLFRSNLSVVRRTCRCCRRRCCRCRKLFTFPSSPEPLDSLTKLGTNHLWMMEIQVCFREVPHVFPRGVNYKIAKIHWQNLKIFFSRNTGPISNKLCPKHSRLEGIQVCSNKRARPFPRGDNYKNWNYIDKILKKTLGQSKQRHKASLGEGDSSFFKWRTI